MLLGVIKIRNTCTLTAKNCLTQVDRNVEIVNTNKVFTLIYYTDVYITLINPGCGIHI